MNFFKNLFSKSYTRTLTVTSSSGFHLRPAAQFVAKAKNFSEDVTVTFKGKTVSAKALNDLLSLSLDKQDTFTLTSSSKTTIHTLSEVFENLMKKDKVLTVSKKQKHSYISPVFEANIICVGIAIAPLFKYEEKERYIPNNVTFDTAFALSVKALTDSCKAKKDQDDADIYLAQKALLLSLKKEGQTLESFETHIAQISQALKGGKLESKISDYKDLQRLIKSYLGYDYSIHFPNIPFILVANDLLPSDIELLEQSSVQGVILKNTSPTSHTAILLRASGIASLILNSNLLDKKTDMDEVFILDGQSGVLVPTPTLSDIQKAKEAKKALTSQEESNYAKRHDKVYTSTQKRIHIFANVADVTSAILAKEEGAEGIGLLRTEFLFTKQKPSLEAQTKAYTEVFEIFDDITVRTLDIGGDKALPYITLPEEKNPFLGIRGVRLLKTHPELISEQLHAIFIAAENRPIKIMFPMISTVEEFNEAKSFAQNIAQKYELDISNILFGIMVEVPSVLFLIKDFNKVVDFYSIGTNDLSQYLFATERTHPSLAVDELSPVIFSALTNIIKQATKPVSICGELASNKTAIPKLIHLGLGTHSVSPKSIAQIKETIRHV